MSELTAKQQRFCEEYVVDCNGTQAAIRAGYSEKTAVEQASRLLINVKVSEYINELQKSKQATTKITAEWIVNEYLENMKMAKEQGDTKSINSSLKNLAELVGANEAKKVDISHTDVTALVARELQNKHAN